MGKLNRVLNTKWGNIKLEDNTLIKFRVAIVDVHPFEEASPFGVEFGVNITTGISVYPSEESMRELEGKPIAQSKIPPKEGWIQIKIIEKESALEEVEYEDPELGKYKIRVEIEPVMASKNTQIKTPNGEPWYVVRWVPKITWEKIME